MARCLVGIVMLAGCDRVFGLEEIPARDADVTSCPSSYDIRSNISPSRYRVFAANATWDAALVACNQDGDRTHLVVLSDEGERLDLLGLLSSRGHTASIWIGLDDRRTEDAFAWVTDEPVGVPPLRAPPWSAGQPDNFNGIQDCVRIAGTFDQDAGFFDDGTCDSNYHYVCECDDWAPDPNNY